MNKGTEEFVKLCNRLGLNGIELRFLIDIIRLEHLDKKKQVTKNAEK